MVKLVLPMLPPWADRDADSLCELAPGVLLHDSIRQLVVLPRVLLVCEWPVTPITSSMIRCCAMPFLVAATTRERATAASS
jgi:hypothetical protein